jgi:hypothetical protein
MKFEDNVTTTRLMNILMEIKLGDLPEFNDALYDLLSRRRAEYQFLGNEIGELNNIVGLVRRIAIKGGFDCPSNMNQIIYDRVKDNLCTFKHNIASGGHWCANKLESEEERTTGYCSECYITLKGNNHGQKSIRPTDTDRQE